MPLHEGAFNKLSWTDQLDTISYILITLLGFTKESDTGTGNSRSIKFRPPVGWYNWVGVTYDSGPYITVLDSNNNSSVISKIKIGTSTTSVSRYSVVEYDSIRMLHLIYNGHVCGIFLLCKSGTHPHMLIGDDKYTSTHFIKSINGDSNCINDNSKGYFATTDIRTISGKDLVSPLYWSYAGNDSLFCDDPINNVIVCNSVGADNYSRVSIGTAKYVTVPAWLDTSPYSFLIRYQ